MELINIVHSLRLAKGMNAKLKILEEHKHNELWKKFLVLTYDERQTFGVTAPKTFDFDACRIDEELFEAFDQLISREVTGNEAKMRVQRLSTEYGEIPRLILGRSVKAGISATTINKVHPGLIFVFKSMKGKDVPIERYPIYTSTKYDGVKIFSEVREDSQKFMTSSGLEVEIPELAAEFKDAPMGMYEGELTFREGKMKHRSVITGLLNSLLAKGTVDMSEVKYRIYDLIEIDEWDAMHSDTTWVDRQSLLYAAFETHFQDSFYVKQIESVQHNTEDELMGMFNELLSKGYEGTISRYLDDEYEWKRVNWLIKKKAIRECVLECIGTKPHSNPAKGIVGSLLLRGTIKDKLVGEVYVEVSTGSGLSKFDIMCEPDRYIGEQIEMMYNSVTEVDGKHSLFLPRYKRIAK